MLFWLKVAHIASMSIWFSGLFLLVRLFAGFACVHARFLARFEQSPALAIQVLATLFFFTHARDSLFEPGARFACGRFVGLRACLQSRDFLVDLDHARACRFDAAAMALYLAGEFGDAAVRGVELALGVVARAFGFGLAQLDRVDFGGELVHARLRLHNLAAQILDFALAS